MAILKSFIKKRSSHKNKKNNHRKSNRRTVRKVKGGSCGCNKLSMFKGGYAPSNSYSPSPSFDAMPIRSFYSLNTLSNSNLLNPISSRLDIQQPTTPFLMGGNKKGKKQKNKTQKKRGGGYLTGIATPNVIPATLVQGTNDIVTPITSITTANNLAGSLLGYNIMKGIPLDYSNPSLVSANNLGKGSLA